MEHLRGPGSGSKLHLSPALNRSIDRRNCRPSSNELFGRLSRLSSNTVSFGRSGEDDISYAYWKLPLQSNALWVEKCRVYIPEDDDQDV